MIEANVLEGDAPCMGVSMCCTVCDADDLELVVVLEEKEDV